MAGGCLADSGKGAQSMAEHLAHEVEHGSRRNHDRRTVVHGIGHTASRGPDAEMTTETMAFERGNRAHPK